MFNKLTMMKRQIKTIQKNLDTSYIDQVYVYIRPQQGWSERGLLGLQQPPNILETTPTLFNHIGKNEFPFTTILVGDRDRKKYKNRNSDSVRFDSFHIRLDSIRLTF